ncbi:siroheme synthase CysG [Beijerinckia sp. L45]|uniref:siroheme synthase CysG n=1 Tax=Beijerinckia sp. L45 TaxID=1641855 RepID=UPI00131C4E60|nr:siroheme synthase CysG [Beijerinckia sp. L45]
MGELAVLPVFFALKGKRVVLAGASERAVWKAELLNATGAQLDVIAADPCDAMRVLLAACPNAQLVERTWQPSDLPGAAMALVDAYTDDEASTFQAAAKAAGVPMNAIDNPAFCDFQFGAMVNRSPLVIGISTHGTAPVFGQAIRGRLETLLPANIQAWAQAARRWRARVVPLDLPFHARRRFWERFSERALGVSDMPPRDDEFEAFLDSAKSDEAVPTGRVTLVGAGPGDPDLITLKALRALQGADIVLYDNLVAPEIVDMARREAQKIDVGKRGGRPSCKQDDITAMMIAFGKAGKRVVRLKGGDPMIFGRANEEIAGLVAAGVPVEVIPGVTAALGAAASLQISLTERNLARRLQFITAHAKDGRLPEDIDWAALCDRGAATVVYMGVKTMDALVAKLLGHGMDAAMPAVLVERATQRDERRIVATIADMPAQAKLAHPDGPCLLMIGLVFAPLLIPHAEAAGAAALYT